MADKTRILGPGSLKIGATDSAKDFSADVINTALEPSTDTEDPDNFLDGHTESGAQTDTWSLTGSIKEDYSMDGLQVWCLKNSGRIMPFEWVPNNAGTLKITGNVTIAPIQIGGDVKSKNANDFSFAASDITPVEYAAPNPGA